MSEKRYPTRMHEVLGVNPYEAFGIVGMDGEYTTDAQGNILSMSGNGDYDGPLNVAESTYRKAINDGIVVKPLLTVEQIAILKGLLALDCQWIVMKKWVGGVYACPSDSEGHAESNAGKWIKLPSKPQEMVIGLFNADVWGEADNLDIKQMLKKNGVEVDE